MRTVFSWILTVAGLACIGAGASGYFKKSNLYDYWLYLVIGGVVLGVVGFFLAREAKVVMRTTMMLQQKQKNRSKLLVRVVVLGAAAVAGYFLIGLA